MNAPTTRRAAGRTALVVFAVALVWLLPALSRPVLLDEHAFLTWADHAARDPWNPYRPASHTVADDRITAEWARYLPPPLGWSYVLAAAAGLSGALEPAALRLLAVLPLLAMVSLGLSALTQRFTRRPVLAALAVALSPCFASGAASLLPDLPLLAVGLFGLALYVRGADRGEVGTAAVGGWMTGMATWLGFQGVLYPGLVVLYGLLRRGPRLATRVGWVACAVPPVGWLVQIAMAAADHPFVPESDTTLRAAAPWAMLAVNCTLLPWCLPQLLATAPRVLAQGLWDRRPGPWAGLLLACALALVLPASARAPGAAGLLFVVVGLVGSGILVGSAMGETRSLVANSLRRGDTRTPSHPSDVLFLGTWAAVVLLATAAVQSAGAWRYLLAALPPCAILSVGVKGGPPGRRALSYPAAVVALAASLGTSAAVLVAEMDLARGSAEAPARVAAAVRAPVETMWAAVGGGLMHPFSSAGHPLLTSADLRRLRPGTRVVVSDDLAPPGWLPAGSLAACALPEAVVEVPARVPVRVSDAAAGAGFHSSLTGLFPVAWSTRPLDRLSVWRVETPCGVGP